MKINNFKLISKHYPRMIFNKLNKIKYDQNNKRISIKIKKIYHILKSYKMANILKIQKQQLCRLKK